MSGEIVQEIIKRIKDDPTLIEVNLAGGSHFSLSDAAVIELADAMSSNTSVQLLSLRSEGVKSETIKHLAEVLKDHKALVKLHLYRNKIDDVGASYLAEMLAVNTCLNEVSLQNNNIGDKGALALLEAIKKNPRIIRLELDDKINKEIIDQIEAQCGLNKCRIIATQLQSNDPNFKTLSWRRYRETGGGGYIDDEGLKLLAAALPHNDNLKIIEFSGHKITAAGIKYFSAALKNHPSICEVEISENEFDLAAVEDLSEILKTNKKIVKFSIFSNPALGDEGVRHIVAGLKHNITLQHLSLIQCHITDNGVTLLAEMLKTRQMLQTLNLSLNNITNEGAKKLAAAVRETNSQIKIHLGGNPQVTEIELHYIHHLIRKEQLLQRLNNKDSTLTTIDLTSPYEGEDQKNPWLSDDEFNNLVKSLEECKIFKILKLTNLGLGDEKIICIINALQNNSAVTLLDLAGNYISDKCAKEMAEFIQTNSSLRSINLGGNQGVYPNKTPHNSVGYVGRNALIEALKTNSSITTFEVNSSYTYSPAGGGYMLPSETEESVEQREQIKKFCEHNFKGQKEMEIANKQNSLNVPEFEAEMKMR